MSQPIFDTLRSFPAGNGRTGQLHSLPRLEELGVGPLARLPVSLRIVLESLVRHADGRRVRAEDVERLARWEPAGARTEEIPFVVARILLQDFTGVPLLVDLAAMRSAVARTGRDPGLIEPLVPVDLVIDHSVQVDFWSSPDALSRNMELEVRRNRERYEFLKWGMQAFDGFTVVPPGVGIVHQVNIEHLARGVLESNGVFYPDSLVGTDSHTTMANGLGIVAWGVGGIEAEAGMLGQPVHFLTPDVVGVHMTGGLREGVTATDLALHVTEMLRGAKVVGKFVEFHGDGAASLPAADRAPVANMAPEYGATMGFFPPDEETCAYLLATGRSPEHVERCRSYWKAQGLFGMPRRGQIDYTQLLELDLGTVQASVAGPRRPQDRINLPELGQKFRDLLTLPSDRGGYGKPAGAIGTRFATTIEDAPPPAATGSAPREAPAVAAVASPVTLGHGDVLIAAITSCTNTSNPSLMLGAGLVAKKAVERGLRVAPNVKASLAPGSRVVTEHLRNSGLQPYLDQLGFQVVGYGCTTCIGNSGPLDPRIEAVVTGQDLVAAAVLSGNRNFEARIHQNIKANFLMSPPLVVAFALAGRVDVDLTAEPIGSDPQGRLVFLRDIWPTRAEIASAMKAAGDATAYRRLYDDIAGQNPLWNEIPAPTGKAYAWSEASTYIQEPPFFKGLGPAGEDFPPAPGAVTDIRGARALAILGDSVTTDHISPAGSIKADSPAGRYLMEKGVPPEEFNSYGSRRGNDQVMTRGTFANVRLRNLMVPGSEGGVTVHAPSGERMPIYEAALRYQREGVPLVVFAGQEYGTGSSRDWAAKGTKLLGVRAVIAQSFERIHRSNLVGMGVLPCQFLDGTTAASLKLDGTERFDLIGVEASARPGQKITLGVTRSDGRREAIPVRVRIDTPIEVDYYRHGGILPYMLRQILAARA